VNQFNALPTYKVPLVTGGNTTKDWYFYLAGLFRGLAPGNVLPLTPDPSPYIYNAPSKGFVIISGGTVSAVAFSRDGTTYYAIGQTAGQFTLSAQDFLKVTYSVAPTMTFVPT
jgi:hypothetical protein